MPNGRKIYQHLPLKDPKKLTQIGTFGLKICRLATLVRSNAKSWIFAEGKSAKKEDYTD
jgi:hypothetical protein